MATQKFKNKVKIEAELELGQQTANRALVTNANKELVASAVTDTELGHLSGVTGPIQTQLTAAQEAGDDAQAAIDAHLLDTADAHAASAITVTPAGNLTSTNAQAALEELQSDVDGKANTDLSNLVTATGDITIDTNTNLNLNGDKVYITSDAGFPEVWINGRIFTQSDISFTTGGFTPAVISTFDVFDYVEQGHPQSAGVIVNSGAVSDASLTTEVVDTGDIFIRSGDVQYGAGVSGDINISSGQSVNGRGDINLDAAQVNVTSVLDMGSNTISNLADGVNPSDAATKGQLDAHVDDTSGAHAASAISVTPSGNLSASDAQAAFEELQLDVDSRIPSSEKGVALGVATLDAGGKVPVSQLPSAIMTYEGVWNASTNSPTLADGIGDAGMVYRVGTAGTQNLGSGSISFEVGDYVIYNGSIWEKSDTTDAVASVFGRTGVVTAQSGDYSASQITNVPAGNISATDVQAAINELDSEKAAVGHTHVAADITDFTEAAQDAVGAMLADSDTIDFTYNDATPELKADVRTQMSITSDASGLKLSGDSAAPGNVKYYGTNASGVKGFYDIPQTGASDGDIAETSFSMANNQTSPANVTSFAFANAVVRSFKALVSVEIDATADSFEAFELLGVQKGSGWDMIVSSTGDDSGVVFSITSAGQIQYTSTDNAGFVAGAIKFRAQTTSI